MHSARQATADPPIASVGLRERLAAARALWLRVRERTPRRLRSLRQRLRCYVRTGGRHEFDIAAGRCIYCKVRWTVAGHPDKPDAAIRQ